MLTLIATNAPALSVYDEHTQEQVGYVTLSSINRAIVKARRLETGHEETNRGTGLRQSVSEMRSA